MPNIYDITIETLRQDIIDVVYAGGAMSAEEIADEIDWYYDDVILVMEALRAEGLVCNLSGEGARDIFGDYETQGTNEILYPIHWRWCGGPVSKALSTAHE